MAFAYHPFSSLVLDQQFRWVGGSVRAVLVTPAYVPDPAHTSLADIPVVARPTPSIVVTGRAMVDGAADATNFVFPNVPRAPGISYNAFVLYLDGVNDAGRPLLIYHDDDDGIDPWPVNPNGGNVVIKISDGPYRLFRVGAG